MPERWRPGAGRDVAALWLGPAGQVWAADGLDRSDGAGPGTEASPAAPDFAAWCAAHAGARCRLWLGAAHLQLFNAEPSVAPRALAALRTHARAQFVHYHGDAAAYWPLLAWPAPAGQAGAGACAVPGGPLATLRAQAAAHGVRLLGVHPGWARLWPQAAAREPVLRQAPSALLVLDEGPLATLLRLDHGRLTRLMVQHRGPQADAQACAALGLGHLGLPAATPVLDIAVRSAWARVGGTRAAGRAAPPADVARLAAPGAAGPAARGGLSAEADFLHPVPPPRLAWLAAATSLAALAVATVDAHNAWHERAIASQALAEATQRLQACLARHAPSARAADPARVASLQALRADLDHPWPAVFAAAEAATVPGVQWLGLDQGGRELRLEGLAADLPTALRTATVLSAQAGWQPAVLTRLQPEGGRVRFELRTERVGAASSPAATAALAPRPGAVTPPVTPPATARKDPA